MSRLYLWSPLLLLSWPPLWLLVQVAQASDWAQDHVPLTSDPPGLTSEQLTGSPHVLAPSAEPGGFAYLTALLSSPDVAPPVRTPRHRPHPIHLHLPNATPQPLDLGLTITPEPTKEAESTTAQQEALPQPVEHPEEMESSPTQQETSEKPPEPPGEAEPLSEQEPPAQPSEPLGEDEPFPTQLETPVQLSESLEEAETSPTQEGTPALSAGEVEPSATLQEQPAQPPEPPSGEAEPLPAQQEQPAQPPEHHEVTVSPPSHHHAQQSNVANVTVKPVDVGLTISTEASPEVGPSPNPPKPSTQPSVSHTSVGFSTTQHEAPTLPPQPPEEVEPLPVQQEAPDQSPEAATVHEEAPGQHPEAPETSVQSAVSPEQLQLLSGQQEFSAASPQPLKEGEPSATQQELQAQPSEPPEKRLPRSNRSFWNPSKRRTLLQSSRGPRLSLQSHLRRWRHKVQCILG
ncbi:leucine-rich repeat-containing protein 37A-like [Phacochoerus africanus]|uniref:leucine-rich repeat-containing protein 37A-like n=1 Tax=Phacochoerus africanus TaxID=41426 RepID=UPI001FD9FE1A|nr:leucine-rich repeat-containing protein 37A-like [Phacochoerus africanus]